MVVIAVPVDWAIYEVEDGLIAYMNSAVHVLPPFMVLEALVLNGKAKRLSGQVTEDMPTGTSGPWFSEGTEDEEKEDEDGNEGD